MLQLSLAQWTAFLLVLIRCGALVMVLPFFGSAQIPVMVKVGLSMALAIVLLPVVQVDPARMPTGLPGMLYLVAGELMIGAILGLSVQLLFNAVQLMGRLVGFQMGFAVANVLDPVSGSQVSVMAQFAFIMTMLTLFAVGAHHTFFRALADSFAIVPPGGFSLSQSLADQVMNQAAEMFSLAVRLGAPLIAALLLTQVVMGILAKAVPQMNLLIVGMPFTISVGLIFLGLSMAVMVPMMGRKFLGMYETMIRLLQAM